jgi:predicted nucleic acid-binding protein
MRSIAIVDTSALLAAADRDEPDHEACIEVLGRRELDLVVPMLAIAEATYLVAQRHGPDAEAPFLRGLAALPIEPPTVEDWPRIADIVERYADVGLGTTDASLVVLAHRLGTDVVVTLDRRHFGTVRLTDGRAFRILPDAHAAHEEPAGYAIEDAPQTA